MFLRNTKIKIETLSSRKWKETLCSPWEQEKAYPILYFPLNRATNLEKYSKCGKHSDHKIGKCQFSFQSQRLQCQRMFKLCTITLISHASKVMLKILQARLQQYMNWEFPDVQAGFRKGRKTRNQIANIPRIIEKTWEFQKKYLLLLHWLC